MKFKLTTILLSFLIVSLLIYHGLLSVEIVKAEPDLTNCIQCSYPDPNVEMYCCAAIGSYPRCTYDYAGFPGCDSVQPVPKYRACSSNNSCSLVPGFGNDECGFSSDCQPELTPTPEPTFGGGTTLSVVLSVATDDTNYNSTGLTGAPPLNGVDLKGTLSGTATGKAKYSFDCRNDGTYEKSVSTTANSQSAANICDYSTAGSYTAKITVIREGLTATDTIPIIVATPTPTPTPTATPVPNATPVVNGVQVQPVDYCASDPAATITWFYSDADGDTQSGYQVQVDTIASFTSPDIDSCPSGPPSGTCASGNTSKSYFTGAGVLQYSTTYTTRVRAWDSRGAVSNWSQ